MRDMYHCPLCGEELDMENRMGVVWNDWLAGWHTTYETMLLGRHLFRCPVADAYAVSLGCPCGESFGAYTEMADHIWQTVGCNEHEVVCLMLKL